MKRCGEAAEQDAARFLERHGLKVRERNYRCRFGEIDLICEDGPVLVFVEVKSRHRGDFGGAAASITAAKHMRLERAARHYLSGLARMPPCRFDAVLLSGPQQDIEWIKNAFDR